MYTSYYVWYIRPANLESYCQPISVLQVRRITYKRRSSVTYSVNVSQVSNFGEIKFKKDFQ